MFEIKIIPESPAAWLSFLILIIIAFMVFYNLGAYNKLDALAEIPNTFITVSTEENDLEIDFPAVVTQHTDTYLYFSKVPADTDSVIVVMDVYDENKNKIDDGCVTFINAEHALECEYSDTHNECVIQNLEKGRLYFSFSTPKKGDTYINLQIRDNTADNLELIQWNTSDTNCGVLENSPLKENLCMNIDYTSGLNKSFAQFITRHPWDNIVLIIFTFIIVGFTEESIKQILSDQSGEPSIILTSWLKFLLILSVSTVIWGVTFIILWWFAIGVLKLWAAGLIFFMASLLFCFITDVIKTKSS